MVSISFNLGDGNLRHNTREYIAKNIDKDRIKNNICYKNESLEKSYAEIFSNSIKEFDEKQKRSDRKIGSVENYMTKIRTSKNGEKLFKELIIQIGDKTNSLVGSEGGLKAQKVLEEYAKGFQKRNPNLRVFSSHLHLDESTPHLHIDFVPVGEYEKGLKKRNSMRQALECQGITSGHTHKDNNLIAWEKQEREELKQICSSLNIEVSKEKKARGTLSVTEYKVAQETLKKELAKTSKVLTDQTKKKIRHKKSLFGDADEVIMAREYWNSFVRDRAVAIEEAEIAEKQVEELTQNAEQVHQFFLQTQAKEKKQKEKELKQTQKQKELDEKEKRCSKVLSLDISEFWKETVENLKKVWNKANQELKETVKNLENKLNNWQDKYTKLEDRHKSVSNRLELFANEVYEKAVIDDLKKMGLQDKNLFFDSDETTTTGQVVLSFCYEKYPFGCVVLLDEKDEIHARLHIQHDVIKDINKEIDKNAPEATIATITRKSDWHAAPVLFEDFKQYVRKLERTKSR